MAMCKECLHHDACKKMLIASVPTIPMAEIEKVTNRECDCKTFKPAADVVEVVRCKNCIWFVPKFVLTNDGERRPYTEEEKNLPFGVLGNVGINCGSMCERYSEWEENRVPVFVQENDFCSYGERKETNR